MLSTPCARPAGSSRSAWRRSRSIRPWPRSIQPCASAPMSGWTVRDTGQGMPPDVVERIYDPFFTTKAIGEGTGIGLSVVHGIVVSYGGTITVESQVGHGTTFMIYLPRIAWDIAGEVQAEEPLSYGQGRLLLVDDEPALVRLGHAVLTQLGYDVT